MTYKVSMAACCRCNKMQPTADMRVSHFGVFVCRDKSQCAGR